MRHSITATILIIIITGIVGLESWFLFHPDDMAIPLDWKCSVPAVLFAVVVVLSVSQVLRPRLNKWTTVVYLSVPVLCAAWAVISGVGEDTVLKEVTVQFGSQELVDSIERITSKYLRFKSSAFLFAAGAAFSAVVAQLTHRLDEPPSEGEHTLFRVALIAGILMCANLFLIRFPVSFGWSHLAMSYPGSRGGPWILQDPFHSWAFVLALFCTVAIPMALRRCAGRLGGWQWIPGLVLFGFLCLANVLNINTAADILLASQTDFEFREAALTGQWMAYFQPSALIFTGLGLFGLYVWPHRRSVKEWLVPLLGAGGIALGTLLGLHWGDLSRLAIINEGHEDCGVAQALINLASRDSQYRREYGDFMEEYSGYSDKEVELPEMETGQEVPDAIQTTITPRTILVNEKKVADLIRGIVHDSMLAGPSRHEIYPLLAELEETLEHLKMIAARTSQPFEEMVVYSVDRSIEVRTVRMVMLTAQKAGIKTHLFAVQPSLSKGKLCLPIRAVPAPPWSEVFDDANLDKPFASLLKR